MVVSKLARGGFHVCLVGQTALLIKLSPVNLF